MSDTARGLLDLVTVIAWFVIVANVCKIVARVKNRDETRWFWAGIFFNIFALMLVSVLPSVSETSSQKINKDISKFIKRD